MGTNKPPNRGKGQGSKQSGELAALLLTCRADRKLSLEQVGHAVGITKKGLSNIERGLSRPRRTTRARLEEFLRKHGYFLKPQAAA